MNEIRWQDLIPLRQKNSDEYVPSIEQIIDYAEFIGLQFPGDQHLLYLAKEGITASLPEQWQACQTLTGDMVYRNLITKQIQAEHPLDLIYRKKVLQLKNTSLDSYFSQEFDLTKRSSLSAIEEQKAQFSESSLSDHFQPIGKGSQAKSNSEESLQNYKKGISKESEKSFQTKKEPSNRPKVSLKSNSKLINSNLSSINSFKTGQSQKSFQLNLKKIPQIQQKQQTIEKLKTPQSMQIYSSRNNLKSTKLHHSETTFVKRNPQSFEQANATNEVFNEFMQMENDKTKIKQEEKRKVEKLEVELEYAKTEKQLRLNLLNQIKQANETKLTLLKTKMKAKMNRNTRKKQKKHKSSL